MLLFLPNLKFRILLNPESLKIRKFIENRFHGILPIYFKNQELLKKVEHCVYVAQKIYVDTFNSYSSNIKQISNK